jgi:hypothetical protein
LPKHHRPWGSGHRLWGSSYLGYLPFAQAGGQLLFHLVSLLYERGSAIGSAFANGEAIDSSSSMIRAMAAPRSEPSPSSKKSI